MSAVSKIEFRRSNPNDRCVNTSFLGVREPSPQSHQARFHEKFVEAQLQEPHNVVIETSRTHQGEAPVPISPDLVDGKSETTGPGEFLKIVAADMLLEKRRGKWMELQPVTTPINDSEREPIVAYTNRHLGPEDSIGDITINHRQRCKKSQTSGDGRIKASVHLFSEELVERFWKVRVNLVDIGCHRGEAYDGWPTIGKCCEP
jgi:hypothetical protein